MNVNVSSTFAYWLYSLSPLWFGGDWRPYHEVGRNVGECQYKILHINHIMVRYPLISSKCNDTLLFFLSVRSHQQFSPHEGSLDLSMSKGCRCRVKTLRFWCSAAITCIHGSLFWHFPASWWSYNQPLINKYPPQFHFPIKCLWLNSAPLNHPELQGSASSFLASTLGFFRAFP